MAILVEGLPMYGWKQYEDDYRDAEGLKMQDIYRAQSEDAQSQIEMQAALGGMLGLGQSDSGSGISVTGMGIGHAVMAHGMTFTGYSPDFAVGSFPPTPPEPSDKGAFVTDFEYKALQDELAEAKKELAERDEIIEALTADMEDVEVLRAEIAALRAIMADGGLPIDTATPDADGWIEWHGSDHCPVDADITVDVKLAWNKNFDGNSQLAGYYRWSWRHHGGSDDITSYRVSK